MSNNRRDDSSPLVLTLDQGGQSSRAMIFDAAGECLSKTQIGIATLQPHAGYVEHDPAEMVESLREAARLAVSRLADQGIDSGRIKSAGLACQRSSIACWDKESGRPLGPIISWQDKRAADWLAQRSINDADLRRRTGLPRSPHYGASKLHWCMKHLPRVADAARRGRLCYGPLASFLIYQLLDEKPLLADPANASRTLLWNLEQCDWDPELCRIFGIDSHSLPSCCDSRHPFGTLSIETGAGGELKIPLTLVTGDQSAALFGFGKPQTDRLYINIGSGAFIQAPLDEAQWIDGLLTGMVYRSDAEKLYALEGTINGAAIALNQLTERYNTTAEPETVARWLNEVEAPPLFINTVGGLGSPFWRTDIEARFIPDKIAKETAATTQQANQTVAVIESILFLIQINLDAMETSGRRHQITVSGGLAQLDGLCQKLADLSGKTVHRPQQFEAGARGLAWLLLPFDETVDQSADQSQTLFKPQKQPQLLNRFQAWRENLYQLLQDKPT